MDWHQRDAASLASRRYRLTTQAVGLRMNDEAVFIREVWAEPAAIAVYLSVAVVEATTLDTRLQQQRQFLTKG